tara:strand:- start:17 stop:766 length:750 start_codon:yes stop_codon:yes gene_type:complete
VQIIPAIDLKDNKCVRLTEGKDETSIVFNDDPVKQASYFQSIGCKKIHIVDLDAAFGRSEINFNTIKEIRLATKIPIQLGGGIRSEKDAKKYFDLGIENLIIGSMSIDQPEKLTRLAEEYKYRIYVSLDIKENEIMIKGWKRKSSIKINDVLKLYNKSNIKGYVITDIKNDGMLRGLNLDFIKKIAKNIQEKNMLNKSIIIAGGLTDYDDLKNLKMLNFKNIEGIISGKSFYVKNIDLVEAQKILNTDG